MKRNWFKQTNKTSKIFRIKAVIFSSNHPKLKVQALVSVHIYKSTSIADIKLMSHIDKPPPEALTDSTNLQSMSLEHHIDFIKTDERE